MDAKQLFFERYRGFQEYPRLLIEGLTEEQQRESPHASLNPITWALWHMARCEDVGVNRLVIDRPQVLDDGRWPDRLRVPARGVGTGMTRSEVGQLCETIDLAALEAYRSAVVERTELVVKELPLAELMATLTEDQLQQVFDHEGAGGTAARTIVEVYAGQTKGWLLGHLALTHHYYHVGQAFGVRALYGVANPW